MRKRLIFGCLLAALFTTIAEAQQVVRLWPGSSAENGNLFIWNGYGRIDATTSLATPDTALTAGSLFVAGTLEVDGAVRFDGATTLGTTGVTLANGETITNATNSTITLGRNDAGTVTVTAKDTDATAALTILPGGAAAMVLGGASTTSITLTTDGGSVVVDGVGITPAGVTSDPAAGTWTFAKTTSGTAAIIGADDAGAADLLLDTTGAGAITVGSIDVTSLTAIVDTDMTLRNGVTGAVTLDFRDYADTTDDDMAHAILTTNCTDASTGAEDCDFSIGVVEAGAAAETRFALDADGGATIGSANTNSFTVTTDGTGDAEAVLPTNSIGPGEFAAPTFNVILCGQLANNNTVYLGPATTVLYAGASAEAAIGGTTCDALDSGTEGTADAPIFTNVAFKATGMYCKASSAGSNGVAFTARSATADLTPTLTCTVATGQTDCRTLTGTTTDIAAGATIAVKAVDTEDLSAQDGWCILFGALK